jgi:hypothetical protein
LFQAALLNQVEEGGEKREQKSGVGGKEESDVQEDPTRVDDGKCGAFLAGMKGGDETEEEADGKDENAQGDGFVSPIDEEEGAGKEKAKEGLGLVGVDWQSMVGGVEHLGQGDEVEEDGGEGGRDGDVPPAGPVVQSGGQDRERGYAVEEDRDSEPEEGHHNGSPAAKLANLQYIGYEGGTGRVGPD